MFIDHYAPAFAMRALNPSEPQLATRSGTDQSKACGLFAPSGRREFN
jgi:hypothetical protein